MNAHVSFSRQVIIAKWCYLKKNDKPTVPLPSKLISLSECQPQQVNDHIQKTVGDEATTSGICKKWHHQYNESLAEERTDIGKYFAEVLRLPLSTMPLMQHTHIKINSEL